MTATLDKVFLYREEDDATDTILHIFKTCGHEPEDAKQQYLDIVV